MTLCKRIIGAILLDNGNVVRREGFKTTSIIGKPRITVKYLHKWNIDELFIINVGRKMDITPILKEALKKCFVPVTVGGSISSLSEVDHYLSSGADKVVLGKHKSLELCREITDKYGTQALCISHDEPMEPLHEYYFDICGEIIIHDKSRDGSGQGLNLEYNECFNDCQVPLIGMGGVGSYKHIVEGLKVYDSVCVGNLLHYKEITAIEAKRECARNGIIVRPAHQKQSH